jgi:hypothetical protein
MEAVLGADDGSILMQRAARIQHFNVRGLNLPDRSVPQGCWPFSQRRRRAGKLDSKHALPRMPHGFATAKKQ